jgi:hypothetical protein
MTRISTLFVTGMFAVLALLVGIAGAAQIGSQTNAQIHNPPATPHNFDIEQKRNAAVKTPTNQPKGQKTISWKPKAIKTGTGQ